MKKSIEAFKKMNRKNKIILISILSGIILVFGATTFAFFSSSINGEKQPLSVTTGTLRLDFNDVEGNGIIEGEMEIGKTLSKRMMISNTGTQDVTATIMWNELENTYLVQSLMYTIKQTQEYSLNEEIDINTLEYNQEVPEAGVYVPRSESPKKTALTRGILIPAGKKIYYEVTITYNHLSDVDQNADLNARLYTSFTIEEGEQLEPITRTTSKILGYTGVENEELVIPSKIQDENGTWYKVTTLSQNVFRNKTNLKSVTIPESVKSIGNYAFSGCSGLTSITIPDSVTSIGTYAFQNCRNLTSITIPDSVTSIGTRAFMNCSNLSSINIPDSVTSISGSAFNDCSSLLSIDVDPNNNTYKSINGVLFTKDDKTIVKYPAGKEGYLYMIPDSVTNIGTYAFQYCRSLTSITIPDSVTSIGEAAFYGCRGLSSITIPEGITKIDNNVFRDCSSLTSITIPDSVTHIGQDAFMNCSNLSSIIYKNTSYTSKNEFITAFKSVAGNIIGQGAFVSTGFSA